MTLGNERPDLFVETRLSSEAVARIGRALEARREATLKADLPGHWILDSPALVPVLDLARRLARAPGTPILIEGERGTGVAELARLIHDADPVAGSAQLRILPARMVPFPELHADEAGTVFIEDPEHLSAAGQTWLVDLIESRMDQPESPRIIAGSSRSVTWLRTAAGVRPELVDALDVGRLVIPPLRERVADILPLARRFVAHCGRRQGRPALHLSEGAASRLVAYSYPTNVRELRNVVERAAAVAASDEIAADAVVFSADGGAAVFGPEIVRRGVATVRAGIGHLPTLVEVEREYLIMLIRELHGRRSAISRVMGVSYPTVLKKIASHGLDVRAIVESATAP